MVEAWTQAFQSDVISVAVTAAEHIRPHANCIDAAFACLSKLNLAVSYQLLLIDRIFFLALRECIPQVVESILECVSPLLEVCARSLPGI